MLKQKNSFGIALCRHGPTGPELLVVNKKNTYAYSDFIFGRYTMNRIDVVLGGRRENRVMTSLRPAAINIGEARQRVEASRREQQMRRRINNVNDSTTNVMDCIADLLDKMTVDEKITILSLNFDQIWGRIFLDKRFPQYYPARGKFDGLISDGGIKLRKMIASSGNGRELWEIPKGRKDNRTESNVECAMREFGEETKIDLMHYQLHPDITFANNYVDRGVQYNELYYLATTNSKNISTTVQVSYGDQAGETKDMQWMTIEKIALVDTNKRLEKIARLVFAAFVITAKR